MDEVYYYNHVYKLDHAAIMPLHVLTLLPFLVCHNIFIFRIQGMDEMVHGGGRNIKSINLLVTSP